MSTVPPSLPRAAATCGRCGAFLKESLAFCQGCGARVAGRKAATTRMRADLERAGRGTRALAIGFVGTLLGLVLPALVFDGEALSIISVLTQNGLHGIVAALAIAALGPQALRSATPVGVQGRAVALALAIGLAGFAINLAYAASLNALLDPVIEEVFDAPLLLLWVEVVALAPLLEEWLSRGILWEAGRRIGSVRNTVFVTAALFALMHGLNGLYLLEIPHRFTMGLLLGWLRHRTGSLVPCVLAHALNNALAMIWE